MKSVGDKFPKFEKTAVVSLEPGKEFETVTLTSLRKVGMVIYKIFC